MQGGRCLKILQAANRAPTKYFGFRTEYSLLFTYTRETRFIRMAEDGVLSPLPPQTYHCLCTTLILTSTSDLQSLPCRAESSQDGALILPPPIKITSSDELPAQELQSASSALLNVVSSQKPVIIRREDGFEKRTLLRCARCKLVLGYLLDETHPGTGGEDAKPVYLLPGGMISTSDMAKGVAGVTPSWAQGGE